MRFSVQSTFYGAVEIQPLQGITENSTEFEYGNALYGAIRNHVENRINATVEVRDETGKAVHRLLVIPKGASILVTDNAAGTLPLSFQFKESAELLPERYLVMVNPSANNNKFYRLKDLGNGQWGAYYGRIGESQGESLYSNHVSDPFIYRHYMYGIKYNEKLAKGYKDVTKLHVTGEEGKPDAAKEPKFAGISDAAVADLMERLMAFANQTIKENYTVKAIDVTPAMVEAAKGALAKLQDSTESVEAFNAQLLELMHIIPRRIDGAKENGVKRMMAKGTSDFARILDREADLLDVMEGQSKVNGQAVERAGKTKTLLDAMGIEVYVATDKQKAQVLSHLNDSLKPKLKAVYRVIHKRSKEAFNGYLERHGGKRKVKVKQFWHGSRNENWVSILQNSLMLRPNAVITGKMFGDGIYFAPSAMKSWGYTSGRGTRWARGNSDTAFMALYATAYGTPYEVFSHSGSWSGYDYGRLKREHPGCSCVHAKKDQGMLREDEIIFYREDQVTINYLVEFEA